jgi:hypothetical protein
MQVAVLLTRPVWLSRAVTLIWAVFAPGSSVLGMVSAAAVSCGREGGFAAGAYVYRTAAELNGRGLRQGNAVHREIPLHRIADHPQ